MEVRQLSLINILKLDKSNVARACIKLIDNRFITRVKSDSDKRIYLLKLTGKGKKLAENLLVSSTRYLSNLLNNFSNEEQELLIMAMDKTAVLTDHIHQKSAPCTTSNKNINEDK